MATTARELPVIRFGTFEVDVRAGELRRNGSRIKLQEQPFQVLITLLDRPGDVITRDELQKKLWPADTFVDFDHSLNAAIRRLREALGDSAENPRFVETVARRGYRFIAPVSGIAAPAEPPKAESVPGSNRKWFLAGAVLLIALLALGISVGFHLGVRASRFSPPVEFRLTANPEEAPVTGAALSPDGSYLAFSDKNGCYLRQIHTGEIHPIPLPAGFNPHPASWFPDGLHLLVTWVSGPREPPSLWTISMMGGQPRKVADYGRWPAVSPDGSQILFVEQAEGGWLMPAGGGAISLMQADGSKPHRVVENQPGEFGSSFGPPAWAPDGKRFAFVRNQYHAGSMDSDSQIEIMDMQSGATIVALNSPRLVGAVTWTNDNRLIYSVLESRPMPGDSNLWAIHIDRMNRATGEPVRLTSDSGYVTTLSISAKGDRLGIVRETLQPDVYVADLQGGRRVSGPPRRLTLDEREDYPFAWSPDDKSVLFASNRDGNYHLFKQNINQTEPELLLGGDEQLFVPRLSPDKSQILYFASSSPKGGSAFSITAFAMGVRLMRLPVAGGPPQLLFERPDITNVQCARLPSKLCLFSTIDKEGLHAFSFDPMTGASQEIPQLAMKTLDYSKHNWSLSPNGETLVTSGKQHISSTESPAIPVINLISMNDFATRTIPVPNWASITTLDWAADGKSVWASAHNTDNTSALLNIDVDGHIRPVLREDKMILGWAIPSSDGRHLALWKANTNSNVWMLKNF